LRLIQRRRLRDTLTALFCWKGVHQQRGGADETSLHGRCCLHCHARVHQVLIKATPELGQGFGEDKRGVGSICVDCGQTTGVHDRDIRAHALTDSFIGRPALVREACQGQQHPA
jgi:hypothetical protein